jgi:cadmium resistance transport/sequestration family protein
MKASVLFFAYLKLSNQMLETVITSILAFASTNIDDIFMLTLLYASRKYTSGSILVGQLLGIALLVGVSLLASMVGSFVDPRFVGLLGFFPIYLGIRQMIGLLSANKEDVESVTISELKGPAVFAIAGITVANGGDNIGVYVPLFTTLDVYQRTLLFIVFGIMVFIWCYLAWYLSNHPLLSKSLGKYAHIVMPVVLFILGIFILVESKAYTLVM